jgi:hypothetical protein
VNYIQTCCKIKNGEVKVDGKIVFQFSEALPMGMDQLYTHLNVSYPRFYKMDNLSKLGFLASEFLLNGKISMNYQPYEISTVLSNASSSLDTDLRYIEASKKAPSPALFVYTLPNIVNGEISIRHGFKGESNFFVTPDFDSGFLCDYCNELLKEKSKICIAGWIEFGDHLKEAFVYLVGKEQNGLAVDHTSENVFKLYSL